MNAQRGKLVSGGRLQIPSSIRKKLNLSDGDEVRMEVTGEGEFRVWTREAAIKRAQAMFRKYASPGPSMVDELIAERREEAARD